jgi:hypothetical protein
LVRAKDAPGGVALLMGGLGEEEEAANARLVAAGPELLKACRAQHEAIDRLFARLALVDPKFFPSQSGQPWQALVEGNAAMKAAEEGEI